VLRLNVADRGPVGMITQGLAHLRCETLTARMDAFGPAVAWLPRSGRDAGLERQDRPGLGAGSGRRAVIAVRAPPAS
jgi:hypothetical protein